MDKNKRIAIGALLFVLLLFSAIFLIRQYNKQDSSTYYYDGKTGKFSFQIDRTGNITQHVIKVYTIEQGAETERFIPFDYGPKELESIYLENNINQKVVGITDAKKLVYITQDPNLPNMTTLDSTLAVLEVSKVTGTAYFSVFKIETRAAFTYDDNSTKIAEFIDCRFANSRVAVILLKLGDENRIYSDKECVIVQGKSGKDIKKAATKLAYNLLGVF